MGLNRVAVATDQTTNRLNHGRFHGLLINGQYSSATGGLGGVRWGWILWLAGVGERKLLFSV